MANRTVSERRGRRATDNHARAFNEESKPPLPLALTRELAVASLLGSFLPYASAPVGGTPVCTTLHHRARLLLRDVNLDGAACRVIQEGRPRHIGILALEAVIGARSRSGKVITKAPFLPLPPSLFCSRTSVILDIVFNDLITSEDQRDYNIIY